MNRIIGGFCLHFLATYGELHFMLNMISISVNAFCNPAFEVGNDQFARCTWNAVNEVLSWPLKFWYTLWRIGVHMFFTISPEKTECELRSEERGDHAKSLLLDMILPLNKYSSAFMVSFAVWDVASSCWNHRESKCRSCWPYNIAYKKSNILWYCFCAIITVVSYFKPQWTNYPVCTDSAPCVSTVKWTLTDFILRFTTPCPAVLWIDVSIQIKMGFVTESNVVYPCVVIVHFFLKM